MGARPLGKADPAAALARGVEATTSLLLWDRNVRLMIDLGTGLEASLEVSRRLALRDPHAQTFLALTHYHEDHWCGLRWRRPLAPHDLPATAFSPLFAEGFSRTAVDANQAPLERLIERLDEPGIWPTPVLDPQTRMEHATFEPGRTLSLGSWTVRTCLLPHPGGCVGYRIEMPGGPTIAVATDCELDSGRAESNDVHRAAAFFEGADVLVIDVQYLDDEYAGTAPLGGVSRDRRGWGHNSPRLVAETFARLTRPPRVVLLTHHDPDRTISDLHADSLAFELRRRIAETATGDRELPTVGSLFDGDLWALDATDSSAGVERVGSFVSEERAS
jgi:glyoxylase-like metal-dependent hydrolase (beta-lactamase superfamily II)